MSEPEAEECDHYDSQVAVQILDLTDDDYIEDCAWCGDPNPTRGLYKSQRHFIAFCDECREIIKILSQNRTRSEDG